MGIIRIRRSQTLLYICSTIALQFLCTCSTTAPQLLYYFCSPMHSSPRTVIERSRSSFALRRFPCHANVCGPLQSLLWRLCSPGLCVHTSVSMAVRKIVFEFASLARTSLALRTHPFGRRAPGQASRLHGMKGDTPSWPCRTVAK